MKRYLVLYLATLAIMVPLDILFLGFVAKGFFQSQVGSMLGDVKLLPGVLFYLIYAFGIVVFVTAGAANWRQAVLFGALFGLVAYSTFDLTALAALKAWTWPVAIADIAWGMAVTAAASAAGYAIAGAIATDG